MEKKKNSYGAVLHRVTYSWSGLKVAHLVS